MGQSSDGSEWNAARALMYIMKSEPEGPQRDAMIATAMVRLLHVLEHGPECDQSETVETLLHVIDSPVYRAAMVAAGGVDVLVGVLKREWHAHLAVCTTPTSAGIEHQTVFLTALTKRRAAEVLCELAKDNGHRHMVVAAQGAETLSANAAKPSGESES